VRRRKSNKISFSGGASLCSSIGPTPPLTPSTTCADAGSIASRSCLAAPDLGFSAPADASHWLEGSTTCAVESTDRVPVASSASSWTSDAAMEEAAPPQDVHAQGAEKVEADEQAEEFDDQDGTQRTSDALHASLQEMAVAVARADASLWADRPDKGHGPQHAQNGTWEAQRLAPAEGVVGAIPERMMTMGMAGTCAVPTSGVDAGLDALILQPPSRPLGGASAETSQPSHLLDPRSRQPSRPSSPSGSMRSAASSCSTRRPSSSAAATAIVTPRKSTAAKGAGMIVKNSGHRGVAGLSSGATTPVDASASGGEDASGASALAAFFAAKCTTAAANQEPNWTEKLAQSLAAASPMPSVASMPPTPGLIQGKPNWTEQLSRSLAAASPIPSLASMPATPGLSRGTSPIAAAAAAWSRRDSTASAVSRNSGTGAGGAAAAAIAAVAAARERRASVMSSRAAGPGVAYGDSGDDSACGYGDECDARATPDDEELEEDELEDSKAEDASRICASRIPLGRVRNDSGAGDGRRRQQQKTTPPHGGRQLKASASQRVATPPARRGSVQKTRAAAFQDHAFGQQEQPQAVRSASRSQFARSESRRELVDCALCGRAACCDAEASMPFCDECESRMALLKSPSPNTKGDATSHAFGGSAERQRHHETQQGRQRQHQQRHQQQNRKPSISMSSANFSPLDSLSCSESDDLPDSAASARADALNCIRCFAPFRRVAGSKSSDMLCPRCAR